MIKFRYLLLLYFVLTGLQTFGQSNSGNILTLYFKNLDRSLYTKLNYYSPTLASIYLPAHFDNNKNYPIVCHLRGGDGGTGDNVSYLKSVFGDQYVLINLPLFKERVPKLNADSSNRIERWIVNDSDHSTIWKNYSIMLDSIKTIIPAFDPDISFLSGFSNGANTISVLINMEPNGIFNYFDNFILIGGGHSLQNFQSLVGKDILFMQGEYEGEWLKKVYKTAKKNKAKAKYYEMSFMGHTFPEYYYYVVNNWIKKKIKKK